MTGPAEGPTPIRDILPGAFRQMNDPRADAIADAAETIIRNRGEKGDRAAAELANAVADRIDQRARDLDAFLAEWRKRSRNR